MTGLANPGKRDRLWRGTVIGLPYAWLALFFFAPFVLVLKISLADPIIAQPPYSELLQWSEDKGYQLQASLDNFIFLFEDNLYLISYWRSIKIAFIATVLCLLLGFPMAYAIARSPQPARNVLLLLVMLPFWTSSLLQLYAWMLMLSNQGVINQFLLYRMFPDIVFTLTCAVLCLMNGIHGEFVGHVQCRFQSWYEMFGVSGSSDSSMNIAGIM